MKRERLITVAALLLLLAAFACKPSAVQTARQEFELGRKYLYGIGVPKDEAKGIALIRKAADQGDAWAQYILGQCYEQGDRVQKDICVGCRLVCVFGFWWLLCTACCSCFTAEQTGRYEALSCELPSELTH